MRASVLQVVVFVFFPLQKAAERAVERRRASSATDTYRTQAEIAWRDGSLGPTEQSMLRGLQKQLGLPADVAQAIDEEVARRRWPGRAVEPK